MSSYGSNTPGYIHPSQYPPHPQPQYQQAPNPPYPTTPGPPTSQPTAYFPPQPQQQPAYSTSPASPWQQPAYASSPQHQYPPQNPIYSSSPTAHDAAMMHLPNGPPSHRRSSSLSQSARPHFSSSAPISIPQQQRPAIYARSHGSHSSHGSHHSHHPHDHHAFGDGEDIHDNGQVYGVLDEETLRQYEKRYAKDRELEKRPTLGGSLMSMVKALGSKRE
ncbi:hypothetical protein HBI56_030170 [Parastagonospora nodorum]|uniref:Uncharacterized protein n=2 Tax=Phaeosphaeria nodorum (strain SN15 / ATCC MYA-4574 / FGSC 10173) TaxID=321614 RepID=A0A7U2EY74_PHANO|nr:hypothetical protein SNOG_02919 [Parastagonospora nodorum SN15]KAH3919711.1 hypothetical protein HBH56_017780 [Parastagonospora nodorum]EAT89650.1 hypothetical protein SNOG_02919 [Parastagonospora nodorum SN15]KAH3937146.1 hypothetical protein HBH54_016710 [Parastagonospora nodorum]KAH3953396.1 hypothetical protein HBH53_028810 [Parastagonospora nodorum]KAH3962752.1 hypothetical protein HBH51_172920 [Parastagonospora nodorum]